MSKQNEHTASSMESAASTIARIFGDESNSLGAQLSDTLSRQEELTHSLLSKPRHTRRIGVANQKGGVGKTTSAVNLAAALADGGLHVLVIDMDPQGNASTALGIDHAPGLPSVYDVLEGRKELSDIKQPCPDFSGLDVVPSSIDLSGAELEIAGLPNRTTLLRSAMQRDDAINHDSYDYVIVDCPPSLGLLVINALCAVDEVLIPIQAEYYALEGLGQLLNSIDLIQRHYNPSLVVSTMLVTMFDRRTLLSKEVYQEIKKHYPALVLDTTIPRSVKISEAPSFQKTVIAYDPRGTGAVAYKEAALEISQRTEDVLGSIDMHREVNEK